MIMEIKNENNKLMYTNSELKQAIVQTTADKEAAELQINQFKSNFQRMQDIQEKSTEQNVFLQATVDELKKTIQQLEAENKKYVEEIIPLKEQVLQYEKETEKRESVYEEFLAKKNDFEKVQRNFKAEKAATLHEAKIHKLKFKQIETRFKFKEEEKNKLQRDIVKLKGNLELIKKNQSKTQAELLDILKNKSTEKTSMFSKHTSEIHPVLKTYSLGESIKSISDLESEIFYLNLQLTNERQEKEYFEMLSNCVKDELAKVQKEQQSILDRHEKERQRLLSSKTQNYCHKEFIELLKEHSNTCKKNLE